MQRTIVEERSKNIVIMDVFSKLIQERIIFIDGEIDDELTNGVIAQMLYLNSLDPKETIHVYINSPGGIVSNGLAIYDVSKLIKAPIRTVCVGQACSMASVLMLMGSERCGLKHSKFMFHQISGAAIGNLTEIEISRNESQKIQKEMYDIIEERTTLKDVKNLFLFDTWFNSEEALKCGLITTIL
jgi:ATP-dependent Clp protease, protease subunit